MPPANDNQKAPAKTEAAAPAAEDKKYPSRAFVRTKHGGDMVHLLTNDRITGEGKRIDIDHFAVSQIEAGKWEIFDPNED